MLSAKKSESMNQDKNAVNVKLISIIVPIYNEQENIFELYRRIFLTMEKIDYQWELIFVDDGSSDRSWPMIVELSERAHNIFGIALTRNFGHQTALAAGYDRAQGDAIITLDADLQDPPELIEQLISKWRQGFHIVYTRRIVRIDGWLKQLAAWWYYKILHAVSDVAPPRNVGDYRLIDREVLERIKCSPEFARYWRGTVAWTGMSYTFVDFKRGARFGGTPGYGWKKSFELALNGLTSFSLLPLRLAGYIGLFLGITSAVLFSYLAITSLIYNVSYSATLWGGVFLAGFMSLQFLCLWFLGEYVGRIYEAQKQWPQYLIKEKVGIINDTIFRSKTKNYDDRVTWF